MSHFHRHWSSFSLVACARLRGACDPSFLLCVYDAYNAARTIPQDLFQCRGGRLRNRIHFCDEYCTYSFCPLNETLINNMIQNLKVCGMPAKLNLTTKSILDRNFQTSYSTFPCQIPFMSSNILLSECFQIFCNPPMSMTMGDSKNDLCYFN